MIALGVILLVLWAIFKLSVLLWIGVALLIIGLVLLIAGNTGHPVGGRRYWF